MFLLFALLLLLFACSNDGFDSKIAASAQKSVNCSIGRDCSRISEKLCTEIGGEVLLSCPTSSSSGDVSSSSDVEGSSSSDGEGSSSSDGDGSSSSDDEGSSSSDVEGSSSSDGKGSSSSDGGNSSSSSGGGNSSSSGEGSSSSNNSSSSLADPILSECSPFPHYVARTKKESIKDLVFVENDNGCEAITYTLESSSSAIGDSISFATYSLGAQPTINITAKTQCGSTALTTTCPISVFVAEEYIKNARCNHEGIFTANISTTKKTTVIEYACCESKTDYRFTQCGPNPLSYTLSVKSSSIVVESDNDNVATLPALTPVPETNPEINAQCIKIESNQSYPYGTLYHYPERILMTVTSTVPSGGLTCNSW
jgi:hypothetical protein